MIALRVISPREVARRHKKIWPKNHAVGEQSVSGRTACFRIQEMRERKNQPMDVLLAPSCGVTRGPDPQSIELQVPEERRVPVTARIVVQGMRVKSHSEENELNFVFPLLSMGIARWAMTVQLVIFLQRVARTRVPVCALSHAGMEKIASEVIVSLGILVMKTKLAASLHEDEADESHRHLPARTLEVGRPKGLTM